MSDPEGPAPTADAATVRSRALRGVVLVTGRGVTIRVLGFLANIGLARMLTPHDFGLVALGATLVAFATVAADGGLGAGLIRGPREPERADLEGVVAVQLFGSLTLVAAAFAVGWWLGTAGRVVALMVASLPPLAFRNPGAIALERHLEYRPLVVVEIGETVAYFAWALITVALGAGVWGLASAVVARSLVGTVLMNRVAPVGWVVPRLHWRRTRENLGFGVRFQSINVVNLIRDQGLNIGVAAVAGVATLGLWSFTYRVLQIPFMLFESLRRVSYPGMARLIALGEDPAPVIERAIGLSAMLAGTVLVGLVASAPDLIPTIFGARWRGAVPVLPWSGLGIVLSGPISVGALGYLLAGGGERAALRAVILHTIVALAVSLALLDPLGVSAVGIGGLASAVVDATVLGSATRRMTGARILRPMAAPLVVAATTGGAGYEIAARMAHGPWRGVAVGLVGELAFLTLTALLAPALFADARRLAVRALRTRREGRPGLSRLLLWGSS